jgi:hypothetical protein
MTLFLNGVFNGMDPWGLAPIYLWGLILWWIVLLPVAWWILKALKWDPFVQFHGLHFAKKNDSAACLITDDTGDTHIVAEQIAKCIFSYGEDDYVIEIPELSLHWVKIGGIAAAVVGVILTAFGSWLAGVILIVIGILLYTIDRIIPWIYGKIFWYPTKYLKDIDWKQALLYKIGNVNYDCKIARILQGGEWDQYPVVNAGGIAVEWIFDSDHWCERRSPQHKAIVPSARAHNKANPTNQVHTYTKYQRLLTEGKIIVPPEIRKDYLVPWVRIDLGFPFNLRNVDWGGKLRQMAKTKENKKDAATEKYFLPLIIAGIGMFFGILLLRILMKVLFKTP